jgi:TetR/AcrR family transcriptional repressor of nem operon
MVIDVEGHRTMMEQRQDSKTKILNAALQVIRAKGYSATRVEDVCEAAGLTKGSFFHHFKSKEDLAVEAAAFWDVVTSGLFVTAPYHNLPKAIDRLLGYVDFRKALLLGNLPEFTCLVGTMVQEVYETWPAIRDACERSISRHAATLEADIAEAMRDQDVSEEWTAQGLALHTQAVIQGAFILAKAKGGPEIAAQSLDHLRRYLTLLFPRTDVKKKAA